MGSLPTLSSVSNDVQNAFNAIKSAEGSNPAYNNPLDLAEGDQGNGTFGAGITIFPTAEAGATAGLQQLELMASGSSSNYDPSESIEDVAQTYAGGGSGATNWAKNVASALGVSTSSPLFPTVAGASVSGAVSNATSSVISSATNGAASTVSGYIGQYLGRAVAIILGVLLIAAGVFSFDKVQTVVVGAAKEGAKAALA